MVKFIYQWGIKALFKIPLEAWIFGAQKAKNETPPPPPPLVTAKLKVREVSQSHHIHLLCQGVRQMKTDTLFKAQT